MKTRRDGYPLDWTMIAFKVKESAGWRCVRCGHPAEGITDRKECDRHCDLSRHPDATPGAVLRAGDTMIWPEQRQRTLGVHHFDSDKLNSAWWNLMALCQVCHLSIQARVEPSQPYMFEHSDWIRIYIAGYYAHLYLQMDVARKTIEDAGGDLIEQLLELPLMRDRTAQAIEDLRALFSSIPSIKLRRS